MPRGYRGAFLAIGLIAFPLWGMGQSPENLRSDKPVEQQAAERETHEESAVEPETAVEPAATPTEPATEAHDNSAAGEEDSEPERYAFQFWGDTWAQWAMAATGVLALIISAWAVWLVRKTLIEARQGTAAAIRAAEAAEDAVAVTRETGEAQVRGYLLVKRVTANINDWGQLEIDVEVENNGLSPLMGVQVHCLIRLVTPEKEQILISDFGENGRTLTVLRMIRLPPEIPEHYVRTFDLKGAETSWLNADDTCAVVVEVDLITVVGDVFGRNIYGHERWGVYDEIRGAHAKMRLENVYATSIDRFDRFEWHGIQIGQMWPIAVAQHR